ncbi:hypothetical protein SAMN05421543_1504 [Alicyclobacillus macrosporangiidus]|uniref:Uncharacterized protein n=1 Tax=Alicyclobacillus macrosporangiidus TaxID=392015 RepID=A0A1I7LH76_9BACL|nr:hypothetical protein SAMN05421543_1504 [Alicyclobacillus macrosporangiidus]
MYLVRASAVAGAHFISWPCKAVVYDRTLPTESGGAAGLSPVIRKDGDDMKPCWVCGQLVIPNTRKMHCSRCQGSVVTSDKPLKWKQEKLSCRELERMMQSANTYERRGGRLRQRRIARD